MNILTLDGGGSKGIYTIGILKELEQMLGKPLHEHFDFIYGTSTGSIIAALIALGYDMKKIEEMYLALIPKIMGKWYANGKSEKLQTEIDKLFEVLDFTAFKTGVGIVATNLDEEKPLIFKTHEGQAYNLKGSFVPGFGGSIAQAIMASCAAYPIFKKVTVRTENQHDIEAIDGGFIGNNPILFAIADVLTAMKIPLADARFLSLGTGNFVEKPMGLKGKCLKHFWFVRLFEKVMKANANTTDHLSRKLFGGIKMVRINDTFREPEFGTNMVEDNVNKLKLLSRQGRVSFGKHEDTVKNLFGL